MTGARWAEIEHLLDLALELPPEDRPGFVHQVCSGDEVLRDEVEHLLSSCDLPEGWLDGRAPEYAALLVADAETEPPVDGEGKRVGPYRIIREAGHGGMGAVYLAERDEPYHQRVALKLVRGALTLDDHLVRRFVEERQILASLEHPHIARLLDGGVTADGLPWFALEYVEGEPIDRYAATRPHTVEERLRLFLAVCDAVQYAHRHLVVHRDLKPSNILVTAEGQVKLLDFGIAKLIESGGAGGKGGAPDTRTGLRLMTPEYASPEQLRGQTVTATSDVYSLGVLLYELLTTQRPYRLGDRSPHEVERAILEQEPERPSGAVVEGRLRRRLRGDLDTIVLTALRKDPARRYPSVERLATDLRRHLTGLPVTARPDTWRYRAGKFVRRHQIGVAAGAAVFLSLVGGLAATAWQARQVTREAARSERVTDFLVSIFREADPEQARGREVSARELLTRGERGLDSTLGQDPELQARLLGVLGAIHIGLGLYARADSLLARAVELTRELRGGQSPELAAHLTDRAAVLSELARFDEADSAVREALDIRRQRFGLRDSSVAATLRALGSVARRRGQNPNAEAHYREALAIDRLLYGDQHLVVAQDLNDLGVALQALGKLPAADSAAVAALTIRRKFLDSDHPSLIVALHNLAVLRRAQGDHEEAERLNWEVLAARRRLYPEGHPDVARSLGELASQLSERGRHQEAQSLFVQALSMQRGLLGPENPQTILTVNNLAILRYRMGDLTGAEGDIREVYENWRRTLGEEHQHTLTALATLGGILREQGRYREAEPLVRHALVSRQKVFGEAHEDVASSWGHLGNFLQDTGDAAGAEHAFRQALAIDRQVLPAGHHLIARRLTSLGEALTAADSASEAEPLLREALAIRLEKLGPTDRLTAATRRALGVCLARLGRFGEAEALLLESYRAVSGKADWWGKRDAGESADRLAEFYSARNRPAEAAKYQNVGRP